MSDYILILCTTNNYDNAKLISRVLVDKYLVACSNIIPQCTSIYRWENKICEDVEYLLVMKSRRSLFNDVKSEIEKMHPYDVPEVISINIEDVSDSYLKWLNSELK